MKFHPYAFADAAKVGGVYDFCISAGWVERSAIDSAMPPCDTARSATTT
jgi:hypothetical protein